MTKTQRIAKLRKREARRIEELNRFWADHQNPELDLILPEYASEYFRMFMGLIDLQKVIAELEYGLETSTKKEK